MAQINIQYTADIQQLNAKLDQIIKKQEEASESAKKLGKDISDASKKASSDIDLVGNATARLTAAIASAFAISKVVEFTKSLLDAERKMELLQNRLNFLAGSASAGQQTFERLEAVSRRLGLNLEDTAEGMASFGIAAQQAGFSAQKSEKIFIQIASGLRAAGASSLQTQRSFYALQQMMSKGVVAAEELRRQLGESLPGASDLMTKAYNRLHPSQQVTNLEFTKLLESGKIISKDILPAFADVVEETFAPALAGKQNSLDAALNKVNNEILKLKLNIGNADWFKKGADIISQSLFELNAVLSSDSLSTLDKIYASLFVGDTDAAKKTVGAFDMIDKAVKEYNKSASQAIITNEVFGKALDKQTDKYKTLSLRQRESAKIALDSEIEKNKKFIEEGNKLDVNERIRRNKEFEDAKSRNEFLSALRIEYYNLDEQLNQKQSEEERKRQEQALKDAVALAKIRVEQAQKGSKEQTDAYVNLANKESELKEFMAKSTAEKQLAEVEGDKAVKKALSDGRVRDLQNQIAIENAKLSNVAKNSREELEIRKRVKLLEAKIAAENANLTQAQINALIDNAIIEINELEAKFNDSNFKQRKAAEKSGKEFGDNLRKIYREALYGSISDPMQLELEKTIDYYNDLIKEARNNAELIKQLEENKYAALDAIRQRFADKESDELEKKIKEYARLASQIASQSSAILNGFAEADRKMRENQLEADLQILNARFEAGVLSEKDYNAKVAEIKREQFQRDKEAAIAKIKIDTALAVLNAFATLPLPLAIISTPFIIGLGAAQISAVESTPVPTFHEGGIAIGDGAKMTSGPLKSDEFIAKLQRGESVIDRQDTQKYKDELSAIREGKFEDYIASKYIVPALERSIDKKQTSTNATSMEMAFQAAEMVNAIKGNKVIKLHKSSIKELAGHIGPKATDKVLARRSWR